MRHSVVMCQGVPQVATCRYLEQIADIDLGNTWATLLACAHPDPNELDALFVEPNLLPGWFFRVRGDQRMRRQSAAGEHFEDERSPRSEARPRRPRVLVALHGSAAPGEALGMDRLVASVMQEPLLGLFVSQSQRVPAKLVKRMMTTIGHCPSDELGSDLPVLEWHGAIFQTVLRRAACPVLALRTCQ